MEILDSGSRTEFNSGAVRDIQETKGRCDLMPLETIQRFLDIFNEIRGDEFLVEVERYKVTGDSAYLYTALCSLIEEENYNPYSIMLDLSMHFKNGALKYGENNWQKGIPTCSYIDSAVRHYLKTLRGDTDENHFIACVWNVVCCIWTCENIAELNSYSGDK